MKMPGCESQRMDRPTIYSDFWSAYLAGYLPNRRRRFIGENQQNCFVHITEAIIFGR
jgi:hypothetical protein